MFLEYYLCNCWYLDHISFIYLSKKKNCWYLDQKLSTAWPHDIFTKGLMSRRDLFLVFSIVFIRYVHLVMPCFLLYIFPHETSVLLRNLEGVWVFENGWVIAFSAVSSVVWTHIMEYRNVTLWLFCLIPKMIHGTSVFWEIWSEFESLRMVEWLHFAQFLVFVWMHIVEYRNVTLWLFCSIPKMIHGTCVFWEIWRELEVIANLWGAWFLL